MINGLYAQDPEIKVATVIFFNKINAMNYRLYISEATIEEIENTPQEPKKAKLKNIIDDNQMETLPMVEEARHLANRYVGAKIIPERYFADAIHLAIATVYNVPVLVSWNFEHMVKIKTKLGINRINFQQGYPIIEISTPKEV